MVMPGIVKSAFRWLALVLALWVLNFALTFHNVWPTLWIETRHELSIEIAVLVLGIALWSRLRRPPPSAVLTALAALLFVMMLGRYAEVTAPALYGRPVNLYWDAQHLPNVAAMLVRVADPWLVAVGAVAIVALLLTTVAALRLALARVVRGLEAPGERRAVVAVTVTLTALFMLGHLHPQLGTLRWFSLPVTGTYKQQMAFLADALNEGRAAEALPPEVDLGNGSLDALGGGDVVLVFLESYGAASYDTPEIANPLADARERLAESVRRSGRQAMSAFVESPTFGGASWLAHASFMTGARIGFGGPYDLLLTQRRDTLPKRFKRSGYRAVALMPGLRQGWPEGAFYGFDAIHGAEALAYRGPEFGWWRIPDQYALAKLADIELAETPRRPLFVFFPTISTHIPFRPTPPYQPDWSRFATAEPYDQSDVDASLAQGPEWLNLRPAYIDALRYAYEYWSGWLAARADADVVLVMLGDHQPPSSVSGEGVRWDVPVHVIARQPGILAALQSAGFVQGLEPQGKAIGPMHALTPLLLDAFAGTDPGAGVARGAQPASGSDESGEGVAQRAQPAAGSDIPRDVSPAARR
jgi:hypothetical protein